MDSQETKATNRGYKTTAFPEIDHYHFPTILADVCPHAHLRFPLYLFLPFAYVLEHLLCVNLGRNIALLRLFYGFSFL